MSAVARKMFDQYGISNAFADKIVEVLRNTFETTYMNIGRLIRFIKDNIENGTRHEVEKSNREDIARVRTIHAEKGLEHPIVFFSDINQGRVPGNIAPEVEKRRDRATEGAARIRASKGGHKPHSRELARIIESIKGSASFL